MGAIALIDTNVLVYRFDPRFPEKQAIATRLLREGLKTDSIRIPHQAVLEFMAVVTRVKVGSSQSLLSVTEATRETEELLGAVSHYLPQRDGGKNGTPSHDGVSAVLV